jgi:hypothetical protein
MKQIELTQGKVTLIDDEDYEKVHQFKWSVDGGGYAANRKHRALHRFIMNAPKGMEVDHIDGDLLNNQKSNLRLCTHAQNMMNQKLPITNTSGYKGTCYNKANKQWRAYISSGNKQIHIGYYKTKELAAIAYNIKAMTLFGDFAKLNEEIL